MTTVEHPGGRQPEVPAIVAEDLARHFAHRGETVRAVDGVSFALTSHQLVAITGPSGSGKSTLLYMIGGLEKPTAGRLEVAGTDLRALSGRQENEFRRRRVGFIFQSYHLIPNLTALENVMLPLDLAGQPVGVQRARAVALLEEVGIESARYTHRPGKLSGGQQQRVAIARALANDPPVILADEPTGNLDSRNGRRIIELLQRLARQGRTIVLVTHDRDIAKAADSRLELEDGHLVGATGIVVSEARQAAAAGTAPPPG